MIQEAGLDGFWIHRVLKAEGIESYVVDPASIATSRRRRRAKTDKIDGEALLRALLAYKRGEPRVCAMVSVPTREDEDRRRISRERRALTNERVRHVNRIKGLLFGQGVSGYEPLRRDRRQRLDALRTGDGQELPCHLKSQINRELDRLELLLDQIKAVEDERDEALAWPTSLRQHRCCCWVSKASARNWQPSSGLSVCTVNLPTGGRLPPTPALLQHPGRAGQSIGSRAYQKRAIQDCELP